MPHAAVNDPPLGNVLEAHLLGSIDYDHAVRLQQRLVYEAGGRSDGQIVLLVCEHPKLITVGRSGSHADVRLSPAELASRQMEVRWVNRGGGCVVHGPGQLAVYVVAPIEHHGWTVGEYLYKLQRGLAAAIEAVGVATQTRPGRFGLWARTGKVAEIGVAVRGGIAYYGAYINVAPAMEIYRFVSADSRDGGRTSSLVAGPRRLVRMSGVRAALIPALAEAFDCPRHHLHTGHPLLEAVRHPPNAVSNRRAC